MTSQTKNYIELADVLAIRCECKHCGATLSLPLLREIRTDRLHNCPNCNEPWSQSGYGRSLRNIDAEIAQFVTAFQSLSQSLEQPNGFLLLLEVSGRQEPSPKAPEK